MRQSVLRGVLGASPSAQNDVVFFSISTTAKRRRLVSVSRATSGGDASERARELLRRAAELREEQAALAAELAAAASGPVDSPDRAALEAALRETGLDPEEALGASLAYDPSAGEVPQGPLRSELERLLGLRPPEDPFDPLADGPPSEEAEALARAIEEGHATAEAPPGFFPPSEETAEEFLARLEDSRARFMEMLGTKKERAAARRARRKATGVREDEREEEEAVRQLLNEDPTFPEELTTSLAVPDIPAEAAAQFHRSNRALLVLRRALLEDGHAPGAGLAGLKARGLVADNIVFEDPWMTLQGLDQVEEYLGRLSAAGATSELDTLFSNYYEYKPDVRCCLVAHKYLKMPLPEWYHVRLALHGQPPPPPDDPTSTGPRWRPGETVRRETSEILGGVLYPRRPPSEPSAEAAAGAAHLRWLRAPTPAAARRQVLLGRSQDDFWELEVRGVFGEKNSAAAVSQRRPDYSALPAAAALTSVAGEGWYAPPRNDPPRPPPLPRAALIDEMDLDEDPLHPDEAEQLLREMLGDADFERAMKQLPAKAVSPWAQTEDGGETLTVGATWRYDVDPATGAVSHVDIGWSWVQGPFAEETDAYDVYIDVAGLMEEDE